MRSFDTAFMVVHQAISTLTCVIAIRRKCGIAWSMKDIPMSTGIRVNSMWRRIMIWWLRVVTSSIVKQALECRILLKERSGWMSTEVQVKKYNDEVTASSLHQQSTISMHCISRRGEFPQLVARIGDCMPHFVASYISTLKFRILLTYLESLPWTSEYIRAT